METATQRVSVQELERKVQAWINYRELGRVRFVSKADWQKRGETVCPNAELTMITEEAQRLVHSLNYEIDDELWAEFDKLLERLGYWFELGFVWSVHFYPLD